MAVVFVHTKLYSMQLSHFCHEKTQLITLEKAESFGRKKTSQKACCFFAALAALHADTV